jgi:hypothetical protein
VEYKRSLWTGHSGDVWERRNEYDGYGGEVNDIDKDAHFGDGRRYEDPIGRMRSDTNAKNTEDQAYASEYLKDAKEPWVETWALHRGVDPIDTAVMSNQQRIRINERFWEFLCGAMYCRRKNVTQKNHLSLYSQSRHYSQQCQQKRCNSDRVKNGCRLDQVLGHVAIGQELAY